MIKQHTGRYTNRVQYDGVLKALCQVQSPEDFFQNQDESVDADGKESEKADILKYAMPR